jgi:tetratricopeptide (TPR) repeat protein
MLLQIAPTLRGESTELLDAHAWEYNRDAFSLVNAQALVDTVLVPYTKGELSKATPLLAVSVDHLAETAAVDGDTCTTCYLSLGKGYDLLARFSKGDQRTLYFQKADTAFVRGLERLPRNPEIAYAYALHLSDAGRVDEGIAVLHSVLNDDPRIAQTHYYLGILLYQQDPDNAIRALTELELSQAAGSNVQIDIATAKLVYTKMLRYFYTQQDVERFSTVASRLAVLDPAQAGVYQKIVSYVAEHSSLPMITFNAN